MDTTSVLEFPNLPIQLHTSLYLFSRVNSLLDRKLVQSSVNRPFKPEIWVIRFSFDLVYNQSTLTFPMDNVGPNPRQQRLT